MPLESDEGAVADATPTRRLRRDPNSLVYLHLAAGSLAGIFGQSGLPIRLAKVRPLREPRRAACRKECPGRTESERRFLSHQPPVVTLRSTIFFRATQMMIFIASQLLVIDIRSYIESL